MYTKLMTKLYGLLEKVIVLVQTRGKGRKTNSD